MLMKETKVVLKRHVNRRTYILLLCCFFVLLLSGSALSETSNYKYEGNGFDSPEEAVMAYIQARNSSNLSEMLATFAIETYVDHLDVESINLQLGSISMFSWESFPNSNEFMRQMKIGSRVSALIEEWCTQALYYAWPGENYGDCYTPVLFSGENREQMIRDFLSSFSIQPLSDFELVRFLSPYEFDIDLALSYESYLSKGRGPARDLRKYRFDEDAEIIAEIRVGDVTGYLFMRCARYADRWYNFQNRSILSVSYNVSPSANGLLLP